MRPNFFCVPVLVGCLFLAACGGNGAAQLIPSTAGPQTLNLHFASFTSSAQIVTVIGDNAALASSSCATVRQVDANDFSVAPMPGGVNACVLFASWSVTAGGLTVSNDKDVMVSIDMSVPVGRTVTFVADASPNNYSEVAQSSDTSVLTIGNGGVVTPSNKKFAFSLTGVASGSATLEISCSGCDGGRVDDWDVPITVGSGATPTPSPSPTPTPAPTATPMANSFTLASASSQTFTLTGSSVGAKVSFFGAVTISGTNSENVSYSESTTLPSNGCSVSGTVVDAITLTFPTAFSFSPNGSGGPTTGLLDTTLTPPSPSGTYYGAIYQAGSCGAAFSASSQVLAGAPYEYLGGGNSTVPAGTYVLELWH